MTEIQELKVIVPHATDAGDIELRAKGVAEQLSTPAKVLGVTVHQRPPPDWETDMVTAAASIIVAFEGSDVDIDRVTSEFGGRLARMHGLPMSNNLDIREVTISMKGHDDTIDEFLREKGYSVGDDDDDDGDFTATPGVDHADQNN